MELALSLCRRLNAKRVELGIQVGLHFEAGGGGCGADEVDDLLVGPQGLASPVFANGAE